MDELLPVELVLSSSRVDEEIESFEEELDPVVDIVELNVEGDPVPWPVPGKIVVVFENV